MPRNQISILHKMFQFLYSWSESLWPCLKKKKHSTWKPQLKNKVSLHHLNLPNLEVGLESFFCDSKPHPEKWEKINGGIGAFHWVFHFQTCVSFMHVSHFPEQETHVLHFNTKLFSRELHADHTC